MEGKKKNALEIFMGIFNNCRNRSQERLNEEKNIYIARAETDSGGRAT
jgi:hypothetical protein